MTDIVVEILLASSLTDKVFVNQGPVATRVAKFLTEVCLFATLCTQTSLIDHGFSFGVQPGAREAHAKKQVDIFTS